MCIPLISLPFCQRRIRNELERTDPLFTLGFEIAFIPGLKTRFFGMIQDKIIKFLLLLKTISAKYIVKKFLN